jgi:release factor glutamine methyltransferase
VESVAVGAALRAATGRLRAAAVDSPELDAVVLLCDVLGCAKSAVLAHPERALSASEQSAYRAAVDRRAQREPLAYVLGHREFYGRDFQVSPAVLVPRPETELLVDLARELWGRRPPGPEWLADVGTGSGALAVTLALELPDVYVLASDRSLAALAVARANASRHGAVARVRWVVADLLSGLVGPFALIVANLPYVRRADLELLAPEVRCHEPRLALDGGPDGLALNRRLLAAARRSLQVDGALLLEIGEEQGPALRREALEVFSEADVAVLKDLAGRDRVLRVQSCPRG